MRYAKRCTRAEAEAGFRLEEFEDGGGKSVHGVVIYPSDDGEGSPRIVKVVPPKVVVLYVEETYDLANALWRVTGEWGVGTDPKSLTQSRRGHRGKAKAKT
jgi:hypothetical protein